MKKKIILTASIVLLVLIDICLYLFVYNSEEHRFKRYAQSYCDKIEDAIVYDSEIFVYDVERLSSTVVKIEFGVERTDAMVFTYNDYKAACEVLSDLVANYEGLEMARVEFVNRYGRPIKINGKPKNEQCLIYETGIYTDHLIK